MSDDSSIVRLQGDLDLTKADETRAQLKAATKRDLVIDFSDVSYIDSSCLAVLISHRKSVAEKGGKMVLVIPAAPIRKIFTLTNLTSLFEIRESGDGLL